jgi:hypothetical protein
LAAAAARRAVGGRRAVAGWAVVGSKWSGDESEVGGPSGTVRLVNFPAPLCVLKFKFEFNFEATQIKSKRNSNKEPNCHTSRV